VPTVAFLSPFSITDESAWHYPRFLAEALHHATDARWQARCYGHGPACSHAWNGTLGATNLEPAFPPPRPANALSWSMLEAIMECDLLHLLSAATRTADLCYAFVGLARIPLVITDLGPSGAIATELKLGEFAQAIVRPEAGPVPHGFPQEAVILPMHAPHAGATLAALYDRLCAERGSPQ
jgi:hypothetical protein